MCLLLLSCFSLKNPATVRKIQRKLYHHHQQGSVVTQRKLILRCQLNRSHPCAENVAVVGLERSCQKILKQYLKFKVNFLLCLYYFLLILFNTINLIIAKSLYHKTLVIKSRSVSAKKFLGHEKNYFWYAVAVCLKSL